MALVERNAVINEYLEQWESQFANSNNNNNGNNVLSGGSSPVDLIRKIAETVEEATEAYLKTDPDPFEDRHPCRARPDCALGHVLKNLFKNDALTNKLVSCYAIQREDPELQTQALRLFLDTLPGLEASVVFKETENLVSRLFEVAKGDREPARSYATGLLGAAMDVQEISDLYKDLNMQLVHICIKRLNELQMKQFTAKQACESQLNGTISDPSLEGSDNATDGDLRETPKTLMMAPSSTKRVNESVMRSPKLKRRRVSSPCGVLSPQTLTSECSNSSWADIEPYMIGSFQMYPITPEMQQRYILQYLTPIMDYSEVFSLFYANGAMSTMKHYINLEENHDIRVAFEALRCLANLVCHKKFVIEFLNTGGLELLLQVYRPSVAAEAVSQVLLYMGYDEDAMEKICTFPRHLLSDMVSYALWLLECSHTSSRCNATLFLGLSFQFRIILDIFDSKDGLRRLLNAIYLLNVFPENSQETDDVVVNEDELINKKQSVRQVCIALKRYFEAHLVIEAENMRRSALPNSQSGARNGLSNTHMYKATHYTQETVYQHVENLLELMPLRLNWKPVDDLLKLGGLKLLISAIAKASAWGQFSGRCELIKNALDVLVVCSVTPKFQSALTELVTIEGDIKKPPISVILNCAVAPDPITVPESEVKKSALHVIINCVCGPLHRIGDTIARLCSGSKKSRSFRNGEDVLTKMWNCVRDNNGIIVLLNQLTVQTPMKEADSIRALACKALCGLARSETVRQIISKLPLFTSGQLLTLMKEPVLQDKRTEHIKFCKSCLQLIESVTGSPLSTNLDTSPANIAKAEVVAQTKITYNEKELLLLIYQHLMAKGLKQSAAALQREASLPTSIAASSRTHSAIWTSPLAIKGSRSSLPSLPSTSIQPSSTTGNALHGISSSSSAHPPSVVTSSITLSIHSTPPPPSASSSSSQDRPSSQGTPSTIPMKIYRSNSNRPSPIPRNLSLQKPAQGSYLPSPILKRMDESHQISQPQLSITLDSIVTEYLRKQHALCKNPVVTCPPFDLFTPHRCPEPINRHNAPLNMALRVQRRETSPRFGGYFGTKFDRKFIYSRFRPFRTIKDLEVGNATCCAFSHVDQHLFTGLYTGEMAVYNIHTGGLISTYPCHDTLVSYMEPSRDGKLILTGSDTYSGSTCSLWTYSEILESKLELQECSHCEFSKNIQNKMIMTSAISPTSDTSVAKLFDIPSAAVIREFREDKSNQYIRNRATFNYTDELVLNDGVLWDIRSETPVHKFDKLNDDVNGVFHPNGWEMISNSEIWDLRNYHLLRTVSALDKCRIKFNKTGDIIYAAMYHEEDMSELDNPYVSSFRTFDATDYTNIATVDCKRAVADLAVDPGDNFIAVVDVVYREENDAASFEYACRLFEVGCCKEDDDDDDDDDDDEEAIEDTDDDQPDNTDDFPQGSDASDGDGISVVSFEMSENEYHAENSEDDEYVTEPDDADEDDI